MKSSNKKNAESDKNVRRGRGVCVLEVPVYLYLPVDNEIVKIILIHLING